MNLAKQLSAALLVCLTAGAHSALAQTQELTTENSHAYNVAELMKELRWNDRESHEQYLKVRDEVTGRLLREIDGYVSEAVVPKGNATLDLNKRLDRLLGHVGRDDMRGSVVFVVNLPIGRFLLIGVEVTRGGEAIPEDAISFRAYREAGNRFAAVADTDYLHTVGDVFEDGSEPLVSINAKALLSQPVGSEFWSISWAQLASASSPPIVTVHLFGFDGERFRTLWTTDKFNSPYVNRAVQVTPDGGFVVGRMPNFREVRMINERYVVTADGPQKAAETKTELR